jgi:deoxyribose-phosphate aldolase
VTANRLLAGEREIASLIDHTLLKPEAAEKDIVAVCRQALEFQVASVCVNPAWVPLVHAQLAHSKVKTCSVIGFPLGASRTIIKVEETKLAAGEGASEIDMVINIGALLSGNSSLVEQEIQQIAAAAHSSGAILKVILETCLLTDSQKTLACQLSKEAGADFVKTSTGFSSGGATEADVALMRSAVGPALGVKASGGVRSFYALARMVRAGASRIGTSSGAQIIAEFKAGVSPSEINAVQTGAGGSY